MGNIEEFKQFIIGMAFLVDEYESAEEFKIAVYPTFSKFQNTTELYEYLKPYARNALIKNLPKE